MGKVHILEKANLLFSNVYLQIYDYITNKLYYIGIFKFVKIWNKDEKRNGGII